MYEGIYIDLAIVAIVLLLSFAIGAYFKKRASGGLKAFFVAGKSLPWYVAGISMVATTFGADTPLAVAELVASGGISANWLWWSMMVGGVFTTIFFSRLWNRTNVATDLELISIRYSGLPALWLRRFKALYLGLFINTIILGWVNLALVSILKYFFGIDGMVLYLIVIATLFLAAAYSSLAGLLAVAFTDVIQFVIAMAGTITLAVIVVNNQQIGGLTQLTQKLPASTFELFPNFASQGANNGSLVIGLGSFLTFILVQWWSGWYPGAEPGGGGYIAQRMLSCKNERDSFFATMLFQGMHYIVRPWPWIIAALCVPILYPGLADAKQGYVLLIRDHLPVGLKGLLLAAFFSAYLSTISTHLNWGASYVVNDFFATFGNNDERKMVKWSRWVTLAIALLSGAVLFKMDSIKGAWAFLIECGAGLGFVLIARWFWHRINAWAEIVAVVVPILSYAVIQIFVAPAYPNWALPIDKDPTSFLFTTGITVLATIVTALVTPPTTQSVLLGFYQKAQPGGIWPFAKLNLNRTISGIILWLSGVAVLMFMLMLSHNLLFFRNIWALYYTAGIAIALPLYIYFVRKILQN